jgi:hypothetical protein
MSNAAVTYQLVLNALGKDARSTESVASGTPGGHRVHTKLKSKKQIPWFEPVVSLDAPLTGACPCMSCAHMPPGLCAVACSWLTSAAQPRAGPPPMQPCHARAPMPPPAARAPAADARHAPRVRHQLQEHREH